MKIMKDRNITQGNPTTMLPKKKQIVNSNENFNEPFLYTGLYSKTLKEARIWILKYSLARAKERLINTAQKHKDIEENYEDYLNRFNNMAELFKKFTVRSSQVGDETRSISSVAFSPDGNSVATTSWSGLVKLWDVNNSSCILEYKGHEDRAQCVTFYPLMKSPSTLCLVSGGADNTIRYWSLDSTEPLKILSGPKDRINKVLFHPSGKWLGSTSFDTTWSLWDIETGTEILTQEGHSRPAYGISFQSDGALVATAGIDALGRVWDLRSGHPIWTLRGHAKQIVTLDFSPNGHQIASGSDDHTVRIWDIRKRGTIYIIPAHFKMVTTVKYQPIHGSYMVTSSFDGTIRIWSTRNWAPIKTLRGHENKVTCVDIHPNVREYEIPSLLVSSSFDRTWKLWEYNEMYSDLDNV